MTETSIEWTDKTWNPVRGCSRVSSGCANCYAIRHAHRFSGPGRPYEGLTVYRERRPGGVDWSGTARFVPEMLSQPLHWKKPQRIFVNSMSDLFHESLSDEDIISVFNVMRQCSQHAFQVLTKRPERMRDFCRRLRFDGSREKGRMWLADDANGRGYRVMGGSGCSGMPWVWLGVSVENQKAADERIPLLLDTPASVRFVSAEPLLGHVDLRTATFNGADSFSSLAGLDWVIVGGESGPGARACDVQWIRSIVKQCQDADVACFVKQLGAVAAHIGEPTGNFRTHNGRRQYEVDAVQLSLKSKKGGDPSEWPEDLRVRQFPEVFP
jgi:protein gp37